MRLTSEQVPWPLQLFRHWTCLETVKLKDTGYVRMGLNSASRQTP